MGKTSIDGLAVRASASRRPQPTASSHQVSDITIARRRSVAPREEEQASKTESNKYADDTVKYAEYLGAVGDTAGQKGAASQTDQPDTVSATPQLARADDEFELSPLEDEALGAVDEAAWSELLEGLNDTGKPDNADDTDSAAADKSDKKSKRRGATKNPDKTDVDEFWEGKQQGLDKILEGDEPKRKKSKSKLPWRPRIRIKHPIMTTIFVILLAMGVTGFVWGDSLISRLTNGKSGLFGAIGAMLSNEIPFETDANGRTNVLVFGTEGYNMDGAVSYEKRESSNTHDGANLTDSIMVISFDQNTRDVAMISIPRDLKVTLACSAGKINEVYWCNNRDGKSEEAGAAALMRQLSAVLGIEFQYWAHVNWGALADVVNTIGGVTVTLNEDINDKYYTGIVIKAGEPTRLNGLQAVGLARARHGTLGGDFTRGNSQQKIMEGIAAEMTTKGVNITEAFNLLNILGDNLRSNFSTDNIKSGVKMVSAFNPALMRNILLVDYINNVYHMTTTTINGISYVVPQAGEGNYAAVHQYIAQILSSNPAVREGSKLAVYNATGAAGVASAEKTKLETDDYTVVQTGDSDGGNCDAKYCIYAIAEDKPATRAALAERYGVAVKTKAELPRDIATSADFVIVIKETETTNQ